MMRMTMLSSCVGACDFAHRKRRACEETISRGSHNGSCDSGCKRQEAGYKEKAPRLSPAGPSFQSASLISGLRSLVDALDRLVQRAVELGIRLLRRQAFRQRTREARDHAVLLRQALV